jgi:hypothetical protein
MRKRKQTRQLQLKSEKRLWWTNLLLSKHNANALTGQVNYLITLSLFLFYFSCRLDGSPQPPIFF